jgi:hypothetical protein
MSEEEMPEAVLEPEQPVSPGARNATIAFAGGLAVLSIAFAFYLHLLAGISRRPDVFLYFFTVLLPAALVHTALYLLLVLGFKIQARGALIFWSLSAAVLLSSGGWAHTEAFLLIITFGFVVCRIGGIFARKLFPQESQGWAISIALGALSLSAAGAFLAWMHLFTWWALALLIVPMLAPSLLPGATGLRSEIRDGWRSFVSTWDVSLALFLQGLFLLGIYTFVAALAPETNSDALRFYWPYMKLLRHYAGFFDAPQQWAYVIPQAGVTYGAAVLILLGKNAVRLAMPLIWAALIGMIVRRGTRAPSGLRYATTLVIASSPVILWVAGSLMLDVFVSITVVTLALLCVEGKKPGSITFWAAVGVCVGMAWAAKYSTLAYAAPLVAIAGFRSFRARGLMKTLYGFLLACAAALTTLIPWLVRCYRQTGNPVFPFLLRVFPSSLWPRGVGFANLDTFRLPPGWRGWLAWPIDLTFRTSRFVEGADGKLGLGLLVLLVLLVPIFWRGRGSARAFAVSGIMATAFLWTQTAYIRYWLPSLWLMALALCRTQEIRIRSSSARAAVSALTFLILLAQLLSSMLNYWPDPRGWPWKIYVNNITMQTFVGQRFGEIECFWDLGKSWPRTWFTGWDAVGYLQLLPMETTVWELSLHALEPRARVQYLSSSRCAYWVVQEDDEDAFWFKAEGISQFFWKETNLVVRAGPLCVYRMPSAEEALRDFDSRAAPGTDLLLDGGFENGKDGKLKFWRPEGDAGWISPNVEAAEGRGCARVGPMGEMRQDVPLPPGVHKVEFVASLRPARYNEPTTIRYDLNVVGYEQDPATILPEKQRLPDYSLPGRQVKLAVVGPWQTSRAVISIPSLARYIAVTFNGTKEHGDTWIDSVHLYVR